MAAGRERSGPGWVHEEGPGAEANIKGAVEELCLALFNTNEFIYMQ